MENYSRNKTVKKKRLRKRAFIPLILIGLIILFLVYFIVTFSIGLNHAKSENDFEVEPFNAPNNGDGKQTVMVLGKDRADEGVQRTDAIMILQYDYMTKQTKIVSIMRDIYVDIPGYQNYKINSVYSLGGAELLRETLLHNFNLEVEAYMIVDYEAFESIAEAVNPSGIMIDVEKDMSEKIDATLYAGRQRLNGKELLAYARFRQDAEGDFGRVRRQQQVVTSLKEEALSFNGFFRIPYALGVAQGNLNTNMSSMEVYRLFASFLIRGDKNIQSITIPENSSYYFQDVPHAGNVIMMDMDMNANLLNEFLNDDIDDNEWSSPEGTDETVDFNSEDEFEYYEDNFQNDDLEHNYDYSNEVNNFNDEESNYNSYKY